MGELSGIGDSEGAALYFQEPYNDTYAETVISKLFNLNALLFSSELGNGRKEVFTVFLNPYEMQVKTDAFATMQLIRLRRNQICEAYPSFAKSLDALLEYNPSHCKQN
jgi:hypothetical protein